MNYYRTVTRFGPHTSLRKPKMQIIIGKIVAVRLAGTVTWRTRRVSLRAPNKLPPPVASGRCRAEITNKLPG